MRRANEKEVDFSVDCARIDLDDLDLIFSDLSSCGFSAEIEAEEYIFESVAELELSRFSPTKVIVKGRNEDGASCFVYIARASCSFRGPAGSWSHSLRSLFESKRRPASIFGRRFYLIPLLFFASITWLYYWSNLKSGEGPDALAYAWIAVGPFLVSILLMVSFFVDGGFRKIRPSKGGLLARNKDDLFKSILLLAVGGGGTKLVEWLWGLI